MGTIVFIIALIISFIWDSEAALVFYFIGRIIAFIIESILDSQPQSQADYGKQNSYSNYYYQSEEEQGADNYDEDSVEKYYAVLGIRSTATDDEVKQAYRDMVRQFHPDMVSTQGENVLRMAERRTQKINEAYQNIKSWRHMN